MALPQRLTANAHSSHQSRIEPGDASNPYERSLSPLSPVSLVHGFLAPSMHRETYVDSLVPAVTGDGDHSFRSFQGRCI
jgi:hypothetical protein